MGLRPYKPCKHRGCNELTRSKEGYCEQHISEYLAKQNEAKKAWKIKAGYKRPKTGSKQEKFYGSKEWQTLRRARLAMDDYLCQECLKHSKIKTATQVHHIVPILRNWEKRFKIDNLESLCNTCHREIRHNGKTWEEAHRED